MGGADDCQENGLLEGLQQKMIDTLREYERKARPQSSPISVALENRAEATLCHPSSTALVVEKSPRRPRVVKPSTSCAWRSRQPRWLGSAAMTSLVEEQAKYWNDASYADFYSTSSQERHAIMASIAGAVVAPS